MNEAFKDIFIFLRSKEFSSADGKIHFDNVNMVRSFSEYTRFLVKLSEEKGTEALRMVRKAGFTASLLSFINIIKSKKSSFEIMPENQKMELLLMILSSEGWGIFELAAYEKNSKANIKVKKSFEAEYLNKEKKEANSHCSFIAGFIEAVWFLAHHSGISVLFEEKIDSLEKHFPENPAAFEKTCSKEGAHFCSFEINKFK